MNSIFIESRKWYDRTGGNSYFSNRVWIDGQEVFRTGIEYGYERAYEVSAVSNLVRAGYISADLEREQLSKIEAAYGCAIYSVQYEVGKRDLFKPTELPRLEVAS